MKNNLGNIPFFLNRGWEPGYAPANGFLKRPILNQYMFNINAINLMSYVVQCTVLVKVRVLFIFICCNHTVHEKRFIASWEYLMQIDV